MRRRLVGVLMLAAAAVVALAGPAGADTGGSVVTDPGGATVGATSHGSSSGSPSRGGSDDCAYVPLQLAADVTVFDTAGNPIAVDGTGQWYEKWCGDTTFVGAFYISQVDPTELLAQARSRLELPLPAPQMNPQAQQVVNFPTWLWLDPGEWGERSATAAVPGVTVTVTAVPEQSIWTMGDGGAVECGAGVPFDPARAERQRTDCSYTYRRSSASQPGQAFAASVQVRWRLSWAVTGAAGGGDLGTIDRTTGFVVPVGEVQAVNVQPGGS